MRRAGAAGSSRVEGDASCCSSRSPSRPPSDQVWNGSRVAECPKPPRFSSSSSEPSEHSACSSGWRFPRHCTSWEARSGTPTPPASPFTAHPGSGTTFSSGRPSAADDRSHLPEPKGDRHDDDCSRGRLGGGTRYVPARGGRARRVALPTLRTCVDGHATRCLSSEACIRWSWGFHARRICEFAERLRKGCSRESRGGAFTRAAEFTHRIRLLADSDWRRWRDRQLVQSPNREVTQWNPCSTGSTRWRTHS